MLCACRANGVGVLFISYYFGMLDATLKRKNIVISAVISQDSTESVTYMADAKMSIDFSKIFDGLLTTQENAIKLEMGKSLYIIIDDDEERLKSMKETDSDTSTEDSIDFHFFSDGYDCMEFLCERISDDPAFEAVVLVGGQRVCEHVREIKHCEQVKTIIVFNPSMPSAGEREALEAEKKVKLRIRMFSLSVLFILVFLPLPVY